MQKENDWLKKRMEDIPEPVVVGKANMTKEQLKKGKKDLESLIEQSTGKREK